VLADIEAWPSWNPAIRDAVLEGGLEPGAHFDFATGPGTMSCRLREVDAPRSLAWSGRLMFIGHHQAWRIEPRGPGCRVEVHASLTGLIARLFRGRMGRQLRAGTEALLELLKLEAEARASESRTSEVPDAEAKEAAEQGKGT
jgi:predicted RNA-binding Zn ribbon-like protein